VLTVCTRFNLITMCTCVSAHFVQNTFAGLSDLTDAARVVAMLHELFEQIDINGMSSTTTAFVPLYGHVQYSMHHMYIVEVLNSHDLFF
jgi:hypothetical protein